MKVLWPSLSFVVGTTSIQKIRELVSMNKWFKCSGLRFISRIHSVLFLVKISRLRSLVGTDFISKTAMLRLLQITIVLMLHAHIIRYQPSAWSVGGGLETRSWSWPSLRFPFFPGMSFSREPLPSCRSRSQMDQCPLASTTANWECWWWERIRGLACRSSGYYHHHIPTSIRQNSPFC